MKYYIIAIMLMSKLCFAHQPDLSTSMLSTSKDGKHLLQITSSLTAFEEEIKYTYSEDSYKTPEEFKELVIKHFNENVVFIVNGDTIRFVNPFVILGHETKLVIQAENLPKEITSFYLQNTMFKDMPNNKMAVMLLVDGFPKNQSILENQNKQTISFKSDNGLWKSVDTEANFNWAIYLVGFLILIALVAIFVYSRMK